MADTLELCDSKTDTATIISSTEKKTMVEGTVDGLSSELLGEFCSDSLKKEAFSLTANNGLSFGFPARHVTSESLANMMEEIRDYI